MSSAHCRQRGSGRALRELAGFPLLDALFGRRSRRFGLGMEIPTGPLAYTSRHAPVPLSEEETLILIAAGAGISGWNLGIPYTPVGDPEAGCNYTVRPIGRTYPSGAATHGSELLITDDAGSYLTRFRDLDAARIREYADAGDLPRLADILSPHIIRLSNKRVEIPPEWPHVSAHNQWVGNRPGATLFVPIADQVDSFFNFLWTLAGEGCPIIDNSDGRLLGDAESFIEEGRLRRERSIPLTVVEDKSRISTTAELTTAAYNIHLVMQAMGLGGWLFSGINQLSLLGAYSESGIPGFGFRFAHRSGWVQPNPIGLDKLFEPLVPPYVEDMHIAAQLFAARKLGPHGNHDPSRPGPFRDNAGVKERTDRYDEAFVRYIGSVAQDIYTTYGRFPANLPTVACVLFTQAQHIDLEFYDRFYAEGAVLPTHQRHFDTWHGDEHARKPGAIDGHRKEPGEGA